MPSLSERGTEKIDMSGYRPIEIGNGPTPSPPAGRYAENFDPGLNVFIRCPLPQVWEAPSDSLRQYYLGSVVPQVRLFTPQNIANSNGGTTINNTTVSSSSSGSSSTATTLSIKQTSVKTTSINSNAKFTSSFTLAKAFQLVSVSASAPCRIQLYGTAAEQSADSYRGLDVAPPAGTAQNIICDVVLDTSPYSWTFQDRIGSNGDNPTTSVIYITVTNLDTTTDVITLSFNYVALVS